MNISIPSDLNAFVQHLVSTGKFCNETEVVEEALRLLRQREELMADVEAGIRQAENGEMLDGEQVFGRLEDKCQTGLRDLNGGT